MDEKEIQEVAATWGLSITPQVAAFIVRQKSPFGGGADSVLDDILWRASLKDQEITEEFVEGVLRQLERARNFVPPHKVERAAAIFTAISDQDIEEVERLLDEGIVDLKAVSGEHDWMTPLLLALNPPQPEIVRRLLAAGADPHDDGQYSASPIHLAVDDLECLRLLLDAGADPNCLAEDEITPIMGFRGDEDLEQVRLLLAAGADAGHVDKTGFTALDLAEKLGAERIAEELLRHL